MKKSCSRNGKGRGSQWREKELSHRRGRKDKGERGEVFHIRGGMICCLESREKVQYKRRGEELLHKGTKGEKKSRSRKYKEGVAEER